MTRSLSAGLALALVLLCGGLAEAELPPSVRADLAMTKAVQAMKDAETADSESQKRELYVRAVSHMVEVKKLAKKLPTRFDYDYARALLGAGRAEDAKKTLTEYLEKHGTSAPKYKKALQLLVRAEQKAGEQDRERARHAAAVRAARSKEAAAAKRSIKEILQRRPFTAEEGLKMQRIGRARLSYRVTVTSALNDACQIQIRRRWKDFQDASRDEEHRVRLDFRVPLADVRVDRLGKYEEYGVTLRFANPSAIDKVELTRGRRPTNRQDSWFFGVYPRKSKRFERRDSNAAHDLARAFRRLAKACKT